MKLNEELRHLQSLAERSIVYWDVPDNAHVRLINVSENTTFLVESADDKAILRIHREGYHSRRAIECELAWIDALARDKVIETPPYRSGRDGHAIQQIRSDDFPSPRFAVLFEFLDGEAPGETGDITSGFEELGRIAAHCHEHVMGWEKPEPFERLTWDDNAVFGSMPTWGNWRDAPGVTPEISEILQRVEETVRARLVTFGRSPDRFNLIHADMRLANLLVDAQGTRVIDFDDCGMGWLMYDFAAAISFIEDDPRVPDMRAAWLRGYRSLRALPEADAQEIDTFVMLRRMALLAWIGSHIEAPEPQALAPDFAKNSAKLGKMYLENFEVISG